MSPYGFSLALGVAGMTAMAVAGLGHAGHAAGGHGHAGHGPGGHGHGGHGGAGHGGGHGHGGHAHGGHGHGGHSHAHHDDGFLRTAAVLSPRLWFTLLAAFGAAGLLLQPVALPGVARAALAVGAAVLFELLLARPVWNFAFRFASRPATTLEACVTDEVKAVTGFDAEGHGLVAVELDGQVVQVLATLRAADRAAGARVRAGDRVRIEEVDAARNRCVVSAFGS